VGRYDVHMVHGGKRPSLPYYKPGNDPLHPCYPRPVKHCSLIVSLLLQHHCCFNNAQIITAFATPTPPHCIKAGGASAADLWLSFRESKSLSAKSTSRLFVDVAWSTSISTAQQVGPNWLGGCQTPIGIATPIWPACVGSNTSAGCMGCPT